jgi:hypothetical protein
VESIDPPVSSADLRAAPSLEQHHSRHDGARRAFSNSSLLSIPQRLRQNKHMKRLAVFVGPQRRRSSSRFITDLAAISSLLTTNLCDVLFLVFFSGGHSRNNAPSWRDFSGFGNHT